MGQLTTAGKVLNQTMSEGVSIKKKPSELAALESKHMQQRSSFSRLDMKAGAFKQPLPDEVNQKIDLATSVSMHKIHASLPIVSIWEDALPDI